MVGVRVRDRVMARSKFSVSIRVRIWVNPLVPIDACSVATSLSAF